MPITKDATQEEIVTALAARIRARRKAVKMTQTDLAVALGVSTQYVCMVERGREQPSLAFFFRACDALSISPNELSGFLE